MIYLLIYLIGCILAFYKIATIIYYITVNLSTFKHTSTIDFFKKDVFTEKFTRNCLFSWISLLGNSVASVQDEYYSGKYYIKFRFNK
jgi:hypothetical protein